MRDQKLRDDLAANEQRVKAWVKGVAVAGAAALAATAAVGLNAASDMQEALNKFDVVFGANRQSMKEWADQFAADVGRSQRLAVEFLASTQDLLIPVGIDPRAAEQMSQDVTRLAIDVASFNNKLDSDVLRDFHSALTGGGETVKKYGVVLDVAATKAKLLENSIDPKTATNAQKVWARWQIILDSTTAAQGDAIRSGDSYANQMKRLEGQMEDLAAGLGAALLPAASEFLELVNEILGPVTEWAAQNPELVSTMFELAAGLTAVYGIIKLVNIGMAIYAQRTAVAMSLSGPRGWVTLAVGITAAGVALARVNSKLNETSVAAREASAAVEQLAETPTDGIAAGEERLTNLLRRIQDLQNINRPDLVPEVEALADAEERRLNGLREAKQLQSDQELLTNEFAKQSRAVDKTAEALAAIQRETARIQNGEIEPLFSEEALDQLAYKITGVGDEIRRVQEQTDLLNGKIAESTIKLREFERRGATEEQLLTLGADLLALDDARDAAAQRAANKQHFDDLASRAEEIRESLQTPDEILQAFKAETDELVRRKLLERQEADAAIAAQAQATQKAVAKRAQIDESNLRRENSQDLRTSEGARLLADLLNGSDDFERKQLSSQLKTEANTQLIADNSTTSVEV